MPEFCDPDIAFLRAGSQANWAPGEEQHKHRVLVRAGVIYRGHRAPCPLSTGSEDDPYLPAIAALHCVRSPDYPAKALSTINRELRVRFSANK